MERSGMIASRVRTTATSIVLSLLLSAPVALAQPASCTTNQDCANFDACDGIETCVANLCVAGQAVDCSDADPCTDDICEPIPDADDWHCRSFEMPFCRCIDSSDCDDDDPCTVDGVCLAGACTPYRTGLDCDDANICTEDFCNPRDPDDLCKNQPVPGCVVCATNGDCDDGDVCSTESCVDGLCDYDPVTGGLPCTDISGSWQMTRSDCDSRGELELATYMTVAGFWSIGQAGGTLSIGLDPLCGSLVYLGDLNQLADCSIEPDPIPGGMTGALIGAPDNGCHGWSGDIVYPIVTGLCTTEAESIASVAIDDAFRLIAVDDGSGRAARMHSSIALPLPSCTANCGDSWDPDGTYCLCYNTSRIHMCEEWRRNDVAVGTNVKVEPFPGGSVTFDQVTAPGIVGVMVVSRANATTDPSFNPIVPLYFDVVTSATYSGTILTCLPYLDEDDDGFVDGTLVNEGGVRLLHEEGGSFVDRTESVDAEANAVCARTSSLSQHLMAADASLCGNGWLDLNEVCDDGNTAAGDGCNDTCGVEGCWWCEGEPSTCSVTPRQSCKTSVSADKTSVQIASEPTHVHDKAGWKWSKGHTTEAADFGSPLATDDVTLCLFEGTAPTLLASATAEAGGTCAGKPCWKQVASGGFVYKDSKFERGSVSKVSLKPGANGKARIGIKAAGNGLGLRSPLNVQLPVLAQVHVTNGECWEGTYSSAGVTRSDEEQFKAKGTP